MSTAPIAVNNIATCTWRVNFCRWFQVLESRRFAKACLLPARRIKTL